MASKDTILFNQVRQGTSLPAIQPASQNRQYHHLESWGVDDGESLYQGARMYCSSAVGRTVGHYGLVQFYRQRIAPNDLVARVLAAQWADVQGI